MNVHEEEIVFRKGRICVDAVFIIKKFIRKRREFNLQTHLAFADLENVLDSVNRYKLWQINEKREYPKYIIEQDIDRNTAKSRIPFW